MQEVRSHVSCQIRWSHAWPNPTYLFCVDISSVYRSAVHTNIRVCDAQILTYLISEIMELTSVEVIWVPRRAFELGSRVHFTMRIRVGLLAFICDLLQLETYWSVSDKTKNTFFAFHGSASEINPCFVCNSCAMHNDRAENTVSFVSCHDKSHPPHCRLTAQEKDDGLMTEFHVCAIEINEWIAQNNQERSYIRPNRNCRCLQANIVLNEDCSAELKLHTTCPFT